MSMQEREVCVLPADCLLQNMPVLELDEVQATRIAQGQRLAIDAVLPDGYGAGQFIGVAVLEGRRLAPSKLLSSVAKSAAGTEQPQL